MNLISFRWAWVACCAPGFDDQDVVAKDVRRLETTLGPLEGGKGERNIRLNLDSLRDKTCAKPLWLYVGLYVARLVARLAMRLKGFQYVRHGALWFWVKPTKGTPVVFLHGLGVGVLPYLSLISSLECHVVADLYYVASASPLELACRGGVPDRDAHVAAFVQVLGRQNKAHCFAHSYGSVVASWLEHARLVDTLALAEPVAVLIHHAFVARSFLYEPEPPRSLIKAVINRVVGQDPVIVHVLMRHFMWFENTFFMEDLAKRPHGTTSLFLSEKDEYTPSALIRARLVRHCPGIPYVWAPGAKHGALLLNAANYVALFNAKRAGP